MQNAAMAEAVTVMAAAATAMVEAVTAITEVGGARAEVVEKVLASPTFVMKGANKVYLFRLPSPDEVMMRTWIAKISQELKEK